MSTQDETERAVADSTLKWLLCARKHMSYVDLITAITMKLDVTSEDVDSDLILDLLNNFVVLDGEDGMKTFRFAHLSVREFLEKLPEYSIAASNAFVAETCLIALIDSSRCLSAGQFLQSRNFRLKDQNTTRTQSYTAGFAGYTLRYWIPHSCDAGEQERSRFLPVLEYFLFHDLGEDTPLAAWLHSYQRKSRWYFNESNLEKLLATHTSSLDRSFFLSCAYGFWEIVRSAMKISKLKDDVQQTALHVAIAFHQYDGLRLLLQESEAHLEMTHELLKEMISLSFYHSFDPAHIETLTWLLDQNEGVKVAEDMLLCAGTMESAELLWSRMKEPTISAELLERAGRSFDLFRMLLGKAVKPVITERLLIQAIRFGTKDVICLVLELITDKTLITHKVLCWAAHKNVLEIC